MIALRPVRLIETHSDDLASVLHARDIECSSKKSNCVLTQWPSSLWYVAGRHESTDGDKEEQNKSEAFISPSGPCNLLGMHGNQSAPTLRQN